MSIIDITTATFTTQFSYGTTNTNNHNHKGEQL